MNATEIEVALKQSLANKRVEAPNGYLHGELSRAVIGAAIEVHRHLGPGHLESLYQRALAHELAARAIPFRAQAPIQVLYKGGYLGDSFADFIVDDKIIVELKVVAEILPVHVAQVLGYLRATDLRLGLVINCNVPVLWRGVRRLIR